MFDDDLGDTALKVSHRFLGMCKLGDLIGFIFLKGERENGRQRGVGEQLVIVKKLRVLNTIDNRASDCRLGPQVLFYLWCHNELVVFVKNGKIIFLFLFLTSLLAARMPLRIA